MNLDGKVALVTGSTSGIGLAIARALRGGGRQGHAQRLRRAGAIAALEAELGALHDGADLSDPAAIERMMERCAAELGAPDILVNNAGIQHVAPVDEFPTEKWDAIIAINLSAAFHTTRLALPAMKAARLGPDHQHRQRAQPRRLAQQERLCRRQARRRRLHQGGGAGGRAATASPSIASRPAMSGPSWSRSQIPDTMKTRGLTREQVINDVLLAAQPTKRFVTPEEVAALALFLCGDEAGVDHRRQPQHGRRLDRGMRLADASLSPALTALAARRLRAAIAQPRAIMPRADADWREIATADRPRPAARMARCLRRRPSRGARAAGHAAEIDREGALLDPDAALGEPADPRRPLSLPGDQARRARARACSIMSPTPPSPAAIGRDGSAPAARQAQRLAALCRRHLPRRRDAPGVPRHAGARRRDAARCNMARTRPATSPAMSSASAQRRWRLVMPRPHFESLTDVMELVPAMRRRDEPAMLAAALRCVAAPPRRRADAQPTCRPDGALPRLPRQSRAQHAGGAQRRRSWRAEARKAGFEVTEKVGKTGVVAVMKNGPGPTLLIRADMDALPVKEQTGLPFASKVKATTARRPRERRHARLRPRHAHDGLDRRSPGGWPRRRTNGRARW